MHGSLPLLKTLGRLLSLVVRFLVAIKEQLLMLPTLVSLLPKLIPSISLKAFIIDPTGRYLAFRDPP